MFFALPSAETANLAYLHARAHEVIDSCIVAPNDTLPEGPKNTTGFQIRVPGGTRNYYPAFWIRDAAMMLGADLVPIPEVRGWVKLMASTQPGPAGLKFDHGLVIPPYSIPDHIDLQGRACWFPGAYAEQGVGQYGHLPPADDAFFYVQMVWETAKTDQSGVWLNSEVGLATEKSTVLESAERAFESVEVDPSSELVVCSEDSTRDRVDWGFCDSIRKSGNCLVPSLLRWQASGRLAALETRLGRKKLADRYRKIGRRIAGSIAQTFTVQVDPQESLLLSATVIGQKDDVWAEAFAVSLGLLPGPLDKALARHLLRLYRDGDTVREGQIRQTPAAGKYGGYWEKALSAPDTYQNGGYWATPTGWFAAALRKVDPKAANELIHSYVDYLKAHRDRGAPFEWVNSKTGVMQNANYGSSVGLVYIALAQGD